MWAAHPRLKLPPVSADTIEPSYRLHGPETPVSPLILSVPHAGRDYPAALAGLSRAPLSALTALEDRFVDTVALAARERETMIVAHAPRAWIDLNRAESERDPAVEQAGLALRLTARSAKVRSGLGLIPRRAGLIGNIWKRRLTPDEVEARIVADHRPYHERLAQLMEAAHRRFGIALLVDIHSMPPLSGPQPARIVIGDRFGRSAADRLTACLEAEALAHGLAVAINSPYPGGHILERHGHLSWGMHAVQLEIDRSLYLDDRLDRPGPNLPQISTLLRAMLDAALEELMSGRRIAAE